MKTKHLFILTFFMTQNLFSQNNPIRIGFWSSWKVRCGIAMYTEHIFNELKKTHAVFVYSNNMPLDNLFEKIISDKINILNIQYIPGLFHEGQDMAFKSINEFKLFLEKIKKKSVKIVLTVHREQESLKILFDVVDQFIFTRPPIFSNNSNMNLIPIGCPVFQPKITKKSARQKYNFEENDIIIATTGFMLPPKQNASLLSKFVKKLKKNPRLKIQLLTSFNNANNHLKQVSNEEYEKIKKIIKDNNLEKQVVHITNFLQQYELNERLWISDIGYLWGDASNDTSSASIKEFISSRLPVVVPNCQKFLNDNIGTIKTLFDQEAFAEVVIKTAENNNLYDLRRQIEFQYNEINNSNLTKKYINVYKKALNL